MNLFAYLVILSWIPVVLYLFQRLPVQSALIISFLAAWLFLPQVEIPIVGLPDLTKMSLTCYGILLATVIFDVGRFQTFRLRWIDGPIVVWCLCPILSSLANNLGLYDGVSAALAQTITWGLPYFLGRLYLGNLWGLRQLAIGILMGGMLYVPLCLVEVRLSPQLHRWFYGVHPTAFETAMRYGGFRPTVFMQHGLMVGVWMMAATLICLWLWRAGTLRKVWNIPMVWIAAILLVTFILVKSTGAYVLLLLGTILLFTTQWFRTTLPVLLLVAALSAYLGLGTTGNFTVKRIQPVLTVISQVTNAERASSLEFRVKNEELLSAKAQQKPWLGWGGWGRARVYDQYGRDISITDSLWIITFGNNGLVGLVSLMGVLLLPMLSLVWGRYPVTIWSHPKVAPVVVLAVALVLYAVDCLVNAMINPLFALTAGGLSGCIVQQGKTSTARLRQALRAKRLHRGQLSPDQQRGQL